MAHPEQQAFLTTMKQLFPGCFTSSCHVLEVGSQDINGTIRSLFGEGVEYLGLDLGLAQGVDWTIPGELIELPDGWADTCISTECFEHAHSWDKILLNMIRITKPQGLLIVTVAGDERATHGTIDSDEASSPFTSSYYQNLGSDDIGSKIRLGHYFDRHGFEINSNSKDTYFWGVRSSHSIVPEDSYWEAPMHRLARAQGQLAQAAARHNAIQKEASHWRDEAVYWKEEALKLDPWKHEVDRLRAELDVARAANQQIKARRWYRLGESILRPRDFFRRPSSDS